MTGFQPHRHRIRKIPCKFPIGRNSIVNKMPKISNNILISSLILSACLLVNGQINGVVDYLKREHSLTRPYHGVGMALPFWDFLGDTFVTSSYVRLTPDMQSKSGAIWNQVPCNSKNWEVHASFKVHGKGSLFGDGFVIWYARDRMITGPVFGSRDLFSGLGIIMDTYSNHNGPHNHQHPYISAMVNNGTLSYDHDRDGTHTQLAGCEARFRNLDYDTIVRIRYENDVLTVWTDFENKAEWKVCFTVPGVRLPTGYYFGASATTGDLCDSHDLLSFKFYDLDPITDHSDHSDRRHIIPSALTFEAPRERSEDPKPGMSNVKIFFIILFGMIFAVAATIFGMAYYKDKNAKKRFY